MATIIVDPGATVTCTYTNTELGAIQIVKDVVLDNVQDFAFTTIGHGLDPTFSLDDDADGTLSNTTDFPDLLPGVYTVTETTPVSGWTLANIVCTSTGGSTFAYLGGTDADNTVFEAGDDHVDITLAAGDLSASCTFINTDDAATDQGAITIIKDAVPNDGQDFLFVASWFDADPPAGPADFVLDDNEAGTTPKELTFGSLNPGDVFDH